MCLFVAHFRGWFPNKMSLFHADLLFELIDQNKKFLKLNDQKSFFQVI